MTESAAYRRYNWLTIGLAYLCVVGFGLYGRQFEPLTGDLTRIGWFSENEFGWAGEQQRFVPPLAPPAALDGSYDIVAPKIKELLRRLTSRRSGKAQATQAACFESPRCASPETRA